MLTTVIKVSLHNTIQLPNISIVSGYYILQQDQWLQYVRLIEGATSRLVICNF